MTREKLDVSVFDNSPAGRHMSAERFDQAGDEHLSPESDGTFPLSDGARSGRFVPEGRNDDTLVRDAGDNGKSYVWNPTPPRAGSCIRGY